MNKKSVYKFFRDDLRPPIVGPEALSCSTEYIGYCVDDAQVFSDDALILRLLEMFESEVTALCCVGIGPKLVARLDHQMAMPNRLPPDNAFYHYPFDTMIARTFLETVSGLSLWHDVIMANSTRDKLESLIALGPKANELLHYTRYLTYFDFLILRDFDAMQVYFCAMKTHQFAEFTGIMESRLRGVRRDDKWPSG